MAPPAPCYREGVFRWAKAWIEPNTEGTAALVLADPAKDPAITGAGRSFPLAEDTSAFLANGVERLQSPGSLGLLGARKWLDVRVFIFWKITTPQKRPIVMIHGLASSPLIWATLSNAIWADRQLRQHFQIWHVVYQTDAPLLVTRIPLEQSLNRAWALLDPNHNDPARKDMISLVIAWGAVARRLLYSRWSQPERSSFSPAVLR